MNTQKPLDDFVHATLYRLTSKQARDMIREFDLEDEFNSYEGTALSFIIAEYTERRDNFQKEVIEER